MLVAPVDVERETLDPDSIYARFRPLPAAPLPFPSLVVASSDDPWPVGRHLLNQLIDGVDRG